MDVEFSERLDLDVMTAGPWMQIRPWMSHGCSAYTRHVIMVGLWSDISEWTMDFMSRDQPMHALFSGQVRPLSSWLGDGYLFSVLSLRTD